MSALVSDVIAGRIEPNVVNAACNASGKLLRIVELQIKMKAGRTKTPNLVLAAAQ